MVITSTDNATFKALRALTTKKGRQGQGLCIIEGEKAIFENLGSVDQIFIREDKDVTPNLKDMEPVILSKKLFAQITDLETCPGILATVEIPSKSEISFPFLVLDRLQDPGNMGTILRTAAAFGYQTIFVIDCVDVWSQKVLRAGMGNQFKLNIMETDYTSLEKQTGDARLFIADMGGSDSVYGLEDHNYGLVLGNEGQGVSETIKELPHTILSIPMENKVESLNVAVAGAILMYTLKQGVM